MDHSSTLYTVLIIIAKALGIGLAVCVALVILCAAIYMAIGKSDLENDEKDKIENATNTPSENK